MTTKLAKLDIPDEEYNWGECPKRKRHMTKSDLKTLNANHSLLSKYMYADDTFNNRLKQAQRYSGLN